VTRRLRINALRRAAAPLISPMFQAWWRLERGMTLGVRAVTTDDSGRVLLVKHTYVKGWHFPGGGVERGETAEFAAVRELAEEAHLAPTARPSLFGIYDNSANHPNDHVLVFRFGACERAPAARDNSAEIAEIGWFSPTALPEDATGGTRRRVAEMFLGAERALTW
jgi:ADP-ribose pyrophosphatase YjhB (NUDIX family)